MPHDFVRALAFDQEGFLWIGTHNGAARFDGRRFEIFRHNDTLSNSLPNNVVSGLACDAQGRMWLSTETDLAWYDPGMRSFHTLSLQMPGAKEPYHRFVSAMAIGKDGFGWFGTDHFLVRLNLQTLETKYYPFPEGHAGLNLPFIDRHGRLWLALDGNTFQFDPERETFRFYLGRRHPDPAMAYSTGALGEDERGVVWVCSWGHGLFYYDEKADRFLDYPDGTAISTGMTFDVLPGNIPVAWVGGGAYGFYIIDRRDGVQYQFPRQPLEKYAHNGSRVHCILRDSVSRIIWLGTEEGLEKYDPNDLKFARIWLPAAVQYNQFCSISGVVQDLKDPDRHWISVWGVGLYEWRRRSNEFKYYGDGKGIYTNEIFSVAPSRKGTLWLAELKGIEEFDPNTGRVLRQYRDFLHTPGINHKILSVLEGRDGRVWIGANYDGLFCLDPVRGRVDSVRLPIGRKVVSNTGIFSLCEGAQGQVYASTSNGLFRCEPGKKEAQLVLGDRSFGNLTLDAQQRLWVATSDGALCFDASDRLADSVNSRNTAGKMRNNAVYLLTTDNSGNLWLGTADGLYCFNPITRDIAGYNKSDGLFSNEISSALQALPSGDLFVAFGYNFNLLNPGDIPFNPRPPRVVLTRLKIANRETNWLSGLPVVLKPGENVVDFEFSVLNFTQPGETVLLHRLVGFEENWVETPLGTPVTYTNLDGGEYTLQVKARNADGVESPVPFELRIRAIPPFYETAWFRVLLVLALSGLGAFIIWYREQERRRLDAIRRRIARDLHDDMGSTLSSIRFFSEVAQSRIAAGHPDETRPLLSRIADSAGMLSDAVRDIVWAIGGKNDQMDDLVTRMREFGLKICEAKNIVFHTDLPENLPGRSLRPDQLRNFYLVFKEAVNNAAKYAGCSEITFRLRLRNNHLTLEIADNGRGFDVDSARASGGNGLSNMTQRAAEIGGKCSIHSAPGDGTRVVLTAPLK